MGILSSASLLFGSLAVLALAPPLCASCQTSSAPPETVHVAVRVFDLNNEPVRNLRSNDFLLTSSNGSIPAFMESPDNHLLLILSPGQGDLTPAGIDALARPLAPLWKAGWHISIHDAQGRQTAYLADQSALQNAVRANAVIHSASVPDAIGTLAEFPGHRVVFVQTGPHFDVEPDTIRCAQRLHAMLYRIGAPRSNRFQPGNYFPDQAITAFTGNGEPFAQAVFPAASYDATAPTPYLHQERTFRDAARHAQLDAAAFYDLRAILPSDTRALTLAVHPTSTVSTSYRVTAQPWAEGREPLPTLSIRNP